MPANVSQQYFETGNVSFRATAAVTGKRFLSISGDATGGPGLSTDLENLYRCAHTGAGLRSVGVNKYDVPINEAGSMHGQPGMIVPVTSGAAITFGQEVQSDANGKAVPFTTGKILGVAMSGVAATDLDVQVKLSL